ncbi:MAG: hypothetical protein DMG24_17350 [Acidobacteria bacterium]|nr:MAG: hypothetical protein DMG24_17350 [Acidobacteriota bacterium]
MLIDPALHALEEANSRRVLDDAGSDRGFGMDVLKVHDHAGGFQPCQQKRRDTQRERRQGGVNHIAARRGDQTSGQRGENKAAEIGGTTPERLAGRRVDVGAQDLGAVQVLFLKQPVAIGRRHDAVRVIGEAGQHGHAVARCHQIGSEFFQPDGRADLFRLIVLR